MSGMSARNFMDIFMWSGKLPHSIKKQMKGAFVTSYGGHAFGLLLTHAKSPTSINSHANRASVSTYTLRNSKSGFGMGSKFEE